MSFRRVHVQCLLALVAWMAVAASAQTTPPTPPAEPAPTAPPATDPVAAQNAQLACLQELAATKPHAGDAKAGEAKAAVCAACHGMDGNSSDKQYPKTAGQNEAYMARQLAAFKCGSRQNPIMAGFSAPLTAQDMHDLGAFFAGKAVQPGIADETVITTATSPNKGTKLYLVGERLYRGGNTAAGTPACMACHGPDGSGMAGAGFPQIGGQWTDYTAAKLREFRSGVAWTPDGNGKIMAEVAAKLSDEDILALASYLEGLHHANSATSASSK